ncbi:MAG: Gfo/Idh/MocA family oxidoreductase [Candidatus Brocadiia bacterium]|nr:Gfo/Idh/MocA family oxidoreductase [Candidatus Brocadiia bacterium]
MAMDTIKVGIIGAGENTRVRHLPGLQSIDGVEVVAVCNRREESTRAVAKDFGIPRTCQHWQEVVAMDDLGAIVIGTWPYLHCEATCAAMEAGKHVLCEARMAMNATEARRMLETKQRTGLVGQIVPAGLRGHYVIKELIDGGYLGDPYEVYVRSMGAEYLDPSAPLQWRQDEHLSGLNVLVLGIYHESVLRWLGDTTRVLASTRAFIPERTDPASGERHAVGIPDSLGVLAEMACGARAVYLMSGVARAAGDSRIEFYGSRGALHYLLGAGRILGAQGGEKELREIPIPDEKALEWTVEADFIASIREGAPVEFTPFEDGVKYMDFTEAVHRSAANGCAVSLPLGA